MIRILLADDHTMMRAGLRLLIERHAGLQVIAEAANGREAVQLAEAHAPDVAVMDIGMPLLDGLEASRQIMVKLPATQIIMLSMHSDESYVVRALKAGARGYLLKDSAEADMVLAIQAVHNGKNFFSPAITEVLNRDYMSTLQRQGADDSYELLTTREREILQLLAEGRGNKEVANMLHLSPHTVDTHRGNIMEKLNLHSVPELILYAVRKGIVH
jgi:two-component system response regulator NreC